MINPADDAKTLKKTRAWLYTISKDLQNHTRITAAQQDTSYRLGKLPGTHTKLEKDQTSVVAQSCLPQTPSPCFKHQAKCSKNLSKINLHQLQYVWSLKRENSQVSRMISRSKLVFLPLFLKNTALIVKLLRNSTGWFSNQSIDFTKLKWNQSIKK